jgi:hypothetical protein
MLLSTTGAGLAVTSFGTNDASVAQYGPGGGGHNGGGGDHGDNGAGGGGTLGEGGNGGNGSSGNPSGSGSGTAPALQPARQVENGAGSGNLPVTGYLAIPVLLGGVALLSTGVVLRRRTASDRS